ncbi:hypothetical protein H5P28_02520 [Ruficoccus amylovorans]|uniref:Uncharacterized protein n=1 Tax=Ruficoccus amylovorans TaxID=1804625 RepID=A0A842HBP3_9BACT|nr:hypothetical protein [Ruficoccus amylovorans]MBC2593126.1 hypothetical protein [Ruficoccus amylovorans]
MSANGDSYSLNPMVELTFGEDFLSVEGAGESVDSEELGLLLSTLCRSSENCGSALQAGALQGMLTWNPGRAFRLQRRNGDFRYQFWEGVTGWEDFDDVPWDQVLATDCLLDVTRAEMIDRLCDLPGVSWAGVRDFESGVWEECACDMSIGQEYLAQATRLVLQLDVLLKGHGCPRGHLRLDFEKAMLWAWVNSRDDYLMVLTEPELALVSRGGLLRISEAFMLL